jgi:hypothetical protein
MQLSLHPALPLSVLLGLLQTEFPLHFTDVHGNFIPRLHSVTFARELPTDCRPSPCGRLSRPPTTRAAPTPPRFHRRIIASVAGGPLTFTVEDSTRPFRWRLPRSPCRSSRNPERQQGRPGGLLGDHPRELPRTGVDPRPVGRAKVARRPHALRLHRVVVRWTNRGRGHAFP